MRASGWTSCASALLLALALAPPVEGQRVRPSARLEELQRRAVTDSLDPSAHFNLAVGYMSRERWDAADSALRRSLDIDPRFALAHLALSVVQDGNDRFWRDLRRRGGDTAVAREQQQRDLAARRAFMFDPFVSLEILAYDRSLPRGLRELMATGNFEELFRASQNERAILMWRDSIEDNDSVPLGLLWINAMFAAQVGRDSVAMRDLGSLVRIMETRERHDSLPVPLFLGELRYTLAALYQRAGRLDDALVLFGRVAAEDIGAFMAHVRRAQIYERFRDWPAAARERRMAVDINPDDPTLARDLAVTLLNGGDAAAAESVLTAVQTAHPRDVQVLYLLGRARERLGRPAEAVAAYETFVARAPGRLASVVADARRRIAQLRPAP